jgi:hypothetical protein
MAAAAVVSLSAVIAVSVQALGPRASSGSSDGRRHGTPSAARAASTGGLTFGVYPGGAAGAVALAGRTIAEDPGKRLAALEQLRSPGRPFVLHIFASYTGRGSASPAEEVGREIALYTSAGFHIELVLTYRPVGGSPAQNIAGFADFARLAMRSFGGNRRFVALQVTNEANVRGAPAAADGAYPGAEHALIGGVVAADAEARRHGYGQVGIGFNWAYAVGPGEATFWSRLGRVGGATFRRSLDWIGLDIYPRTWGPTVEGSLTAATRKAVLASLRALRGRYLPLAGIPARVPLHISENGYPTGPGRTEAMQVTAMKAAVSTVFANRSIYGVTDFRWFDLRDADSSSPTFESRYGLMRDDYSPKAGFSVYRKLVATLTRGRH